MNPKIISRPIWILSLVSLFADLASEMLYPIMPVYLKSVGFSIALIGLLEGVAEVTAGLSKGYFGQLSDRWGQRLPFVRLGYTLSALSKPLMAVFALPGWIFAARTLDRLGKGLRTAPRDALLADQSDRETRGQVFGFHRSMDTLGGVLGPVAALIYLYYYPGHYVPLFLLAFGPGLLSIGLTFLLRDRATQRPPEPTTASGQPASVPALLHYWKNSPPDYRRVVGGLLVFALFNSSDVFLLLKIKEVGLSDTAVVGLYVFYNLVYAVMAYPVGRLADRLGLKPTLLVGLGLFALVYEGMVVANHLPVFVGLLGLYGVYAAATEGIAKAWISTISGPKDTATAIGTYAGLSSLCALVANALAGWLWYAFGAPVTFALTGAATLGVILYLVALEGRREELVPLHTLRAVSDTDVGLKGLVAQPGASEPADRRSTITMTRSAFAALFLLIACLSAWTIYMSYVAISTTFGPRAGNTATSASATGVGASATDATPAIARHTGPRRPAGAGKAGTGFGTDPNGTPAEQPMLVDLLAAKRRAAMGNGVGANDKIVLGAPAAGTSAANPAGRAPLKPAERHRNRVQLYTMTGLLTHFYARPSKRSQKRAFLNVGKKVIVTPQAEKNGFYYVVYTTKKGQRISGWLPKKVLRPVRLTTPLYSS